MTTTEDLQDIQGYTRIEGGGRTIDANSNALFELTRTTSLAINNVRITGGGRSDGGAIYNNNGTVTVTGVTFESNTTAGDGGAINQASGTTTISGSAFISNTAGGGGGAIYQGDGTLTIDSSTFIDNSSTQDGGGIHISSGTATLAHLTIWNNRNAVTGGDWVTGVVAGGTTNLYNSIIGRDSVSTQKLCGGSFNNDTQQRGVIIHNPANTNEGCPAATEADPQLSGQAGSPAFKPLNAGSPARGAGVDAICALYPKDQRGASRPAADCDIGAVQFILPQKQTDEAPSAPAGPTATPICSGDWLTRNTGIRVWATYGLCSGVQFRRIGTDGIGNQVVIDNGFIDAVDVWGYAEQGVEVCFPAYGSVVLLDASTAPRALIPLQSYLDGTMTCAQFAMAGTAALISAESSLSLPPTSGPPPTGLANCLVTTTHILNLRDAPGGEVIDLLPYNATLTATARTDAWFEVDANGVVGWISADYVTTAGNCG